MLKALRGENGEVVSPSQSNRGCGGAWYKRFWCILSQPESNNNSANVITKSSLYTTGHVVIVCRAHFSSRHTPLQRNKKCVIAHSLLLITPTSANIVSSKNSNVDSTNITGDRVTLSDTSDRLSCRQSSDLTAIKLLDDAIHFV